MFWFCGMCTEEALIVPFSNQSEIVNLQYLKNVLYRDVLHKYRTTELRKIIAGKICGSWSHSINTWTQHWTSIIHTILISLWKANSNEEWFWMKSMRALMITSGADQWLSLAECRSVIRAPLHWSEGRPCPDHWLAASLFFLPANLRDENTYNCNF